MSKCAGWDATTVDLVRRGGEVVKPEERKRNLVNHVPLMMDTSSGSREIKLVASGRATSRGRGANQMSDDTIHDWNDLNVRTVVGDDDGDDEVTIVNRTLKRDRCRHEYATGSRHEEEIRAELNTVRIKRGADAKDVLMFVGRRRTWGQKRGSNAPRCQVLREVPEEASAEVRPWQVHDKRCRRSLRLGLVGVPLLQQIHQRSVLGCESVETALTPHERYPGVVEYHDVVIAAAEGFGLEALAQGSGGREQRADLRRQRRGQRDRDEALLSPSESYGCEVLVGPGGSDKHDGN